MSEKLTIIDSEFIEQAFSFWFTDQKHIRSPFPTYTHSALKPAAIEKFEEWLANIHKDAKDEFNDEMIAEKFEEILFETGLTLIQTEDERLTILYPFLPRVSDKIKDDKQIENIIISRFLKEVGDDKFLEIKCINKSTKEEWITSFELPV